MKDFKNLKEVYYQDRIVFTLDAERLFTLFEQWRETVQPNDRAYLGALNFLKFIID